MDRYSQEHQEHVNQFDFMDSNKHKKKDCRACRDFTDWLTAKKSAKTEQTNNESSHSMTKKEDTSNEETKRLDCPLYRNELGRYTWGLLHTMAVYYPKNPNDEDQDKMRSFIDGLARFFPCDECSTDFRDEIKKSPPRIQNRFELSQWFCEQHNIVNRKLGKNEFDCSRVFERWKHGWKDGSCEK